MRVPTTCRGGGCPGPRDTIGPDGPETEAMEKAGKVYAFIEESNRMVTECLNEIRSWDSSKGGMGDDHHFALHSMILLFNSSPSTGES